MKLGKRLIIYGDSILRGVTYCEQKGGYRLRNGYRMEKISAQGIDVVNHARMGATITRGLDLLCHHAQECEPGDTVLLEFGGNDCDYEWGEIARDPEGEFLPHTPEAEFVERYRNAVAQVRERGAQVMLATLVPVDADKYLHWITRERSYDNILRWLGDVSMLYRWQEHYNRIVERLAREVACPLVDLRERFLLSHNYKNLLSYDGIHPTERGHALIENTICQCL